MRAIGQLLQKTMPGTNAFCTSAPGVWWLEAELQTELDQPWVCAGVYAGYLAKRRAANRSIGRGPLRAIEHIEEFSSERDG
jgi:hypothetical protein